MPLRMFATILKRPTKENSRKHSSSSMPTVEIGVGVFVIPEPRQPSLPPPSGLSIVLNPHHQEMPGLT